MNQIDCWVKSAKSSRGIWDLHQGIKLELYFFLEPFFPWEKDWFDRYWNGNS